MSNLQNMGINAMPKIDSSTIHHARERELAL